MSGVWVGGGGGGLVRLGFLPFNKADKAIFNGNGTLFTSHTQLVH